MCALKTVKKASTKASSRIPEVSAREAAKLRLADRRQQAMQAVQSTNQSAVRRRDQDYYKQPDDRNRQSENRQQSNQTRSLRLATDQTGSPLRIIGGRASETSESVETTKHRRITVKNKQSRYLLPVNLSIVLVACILAGFLIYPALTDWWHVRRNIDLLEAESTALAVRNGQIQQQIDALATPEGIASRAREQYGWVMPGERAVNVTGLTSNDSSTALPENIASGTVHPEIDWITETLDFVLGYQYPSPPPAAADDVIIGL
ncbi:MAG: septum formation initiator family protein [Coriobacteriales bacterium]|jgi:cell division protein FtsB|nr:septum formation initiator family protein [Coriobacteriales bacterium]